MMHLLRRIPLLIWVLLFAALLVRMGLAVSIVGHPTDMNTFKAWAIYAAEHGLSKFYSGEIFADYPPGYIYVLFLIGKIRLWFDLDHTGNGFLLLVKMPAILADLTASFLIYWAAAKRWNLAVAAGLMASYALNPAIFVNSAAWGQVDSIFTLFVVIFVLLAIRGKLPYATIVFAIALLIKPQTLIFTPVLLYAFYKGRSWKTLIWSAVYGLATFIVLILPFGAGKSWFWIIELYTQTLSSYPYASLNAFNLIALTGGNWLDVSTRLLLSYQVWGIIFIVATVAYSLYLFVKFRKHSWVLLIISVAIIVLVFLLTAKMHERYLFPALLLMLFSYIKIQDRRLLYLYIGLSFTHFINVAYVLSFNVQEIYHLARFDKVLLITSAANLLLVVFMIMAMNRLDRPLTTSPARSLLPPLEQATFQRQEVVRELRLSRKDFIIIGVITMVYAVLAFYKLGDHKAPETYWQPVMSDSVIFDLGSTFPLEKINMYAGVGGGKFLIDASTDSKTWTSLKVTEAQYTGVFAWNTLIDLPDSRFIKVTADSSNIRLHEIGIFVRGEEKPAQIQSILPGVTGEALPSNSERLVDEQELVPYAPSFMNSMYFDEIYHGRTAYEHIHLIEPYETTHPPLGKDIIAVGILAFGMDPFGWRVMGTIFGILMIPLMYVFAFRIFQRTVYATWAALLLAFDFMHFVQTRISTVDVYLVFFIMLMFYYMYRYSKLDVYKRGLARSLVPLFLSGLFFGMAAATKWSAMYGGVGLAAIFAYCMVVRHLEYRRAVHFINKGSEILETKSSFEKGGDRVEAEHIVKRYPLFAVKTVVYTGLFFTVIPILVYVLSYIPFLMVPGPGHGLYNVMTFQKFMYDYHSKLVATHAFASPWWQWPVMVKPVWYYSGPQLPAGKVASIVALGNPLIWWAGIIAFGYTLYSLFRKKSAWIMLVPVVAYVSLYLPWTLVPRLTFLYHYFPMVPFLILFLVYTLKAISERYEYGRQIGTAYLIVAGLVFALFYPVLSGMVVYKDFVNFGLRWFPSWIF